MSKDERNDKLSEQDNQELQSNMPEEMPEIESQSSGSRQPESEFELPELEELNTQSKDEVKDDELSTSHTGDEGKDELPEFQDQELSLGSELLDLEELDAEPHNDAKDDNFPKFTPQSTHDNKNKAFGSSNNEQIDQRLQLLQRMLIQQRNNAHQWRQRPNDEKRMFRMLAQDRILRMVFERRLQGAKYHNLPPQQAFNLLYEIRNDLKVMARQTALLTMGKQLDPNSPMAISLKLSNPNSIESQFAAQQAGAVNQGIINDENNIQAEEVNAENLTQSSNITHELTHDLVKTAEIGAGLEAIDDIATSNSVKQFGEDAIDIGKRIELDAKDFEEISNNKLTPEFSSSEEEDEYDHQFQQQAFNEFAKGNKSGLMSSLEGHAGSGLVDSAASNPEVAKLAITATTGVPVM